MPIRDGYQYLSRYTVYGIAFMFIIIFIVANMIAIAVNPSEERLILLLAFIVLFSLIVIVFFAYQKISFPEQKIEDYSLKK